MNDTVHLPSGDGDEKKDVIEYEDMLVNDVHCKIKKVTTEVGKMVITLESELFSPDDAGNLVKMQQQGYATLQLQSIPPEPDDDDG